MTTTIKDDFMQRIAKEEAWKKLSENLLSDDYQCYTL